MSALDQFIAQQAGKPRYQVDLALDHRCDFGNCLARAVTVAVTNIVDDRRTPTGIVELRGVCEAHAGRISSTVEVARWVVDQ